MNGKAIDAIGGLGAALIVVGAGLVYLPAGLITAGIMLLFSAIIGASRTRTPAGPEKARGSTRGSPE